MRHHRSVARFVLDREARFRQRSQAEHRGHDLWRWIERAGTDVEAGLGVEPGREHDGKASIFLAAGIGRDAARDLFLKHEMHVAYRVPMAK